MNQPLARALGYLRQSKLRPNESAETSLSLDAQESRVAAYCTAQGWTVAGVYRDADVVGDDPDRPALRAALAAAEAGGIDVFVVFALSRLARDNLLQETIWRRLRVAGVRLVSVTEPHAEDDLVRGILGAVSAAERVRMGKFLSASFRQRAERGLHHGLPPYGYRKGMDVSLEQAAIVREIFARYRAGEGSTVLARDLMRRQVTAPAGGHSWHPDGILRILRNPAYIGRVRHKGVEHDGAWPPIIDRAIWDDVQRLLSSSVRASKTPYANRSPLQGLIWCGCGARMWMTATVKRPPKPAINAFRCARTISPAQGTCTQSQTRIGRKRAEAAVLAQLRADIAGRITPAEWYTRAVARLDAEAPDRARRRGDLEKRRRVLDKRRERVESWYLAGRRDLAWAAAQGAEIDAELAAVDAEMASVPAPPNRATAEATARTLDSISDALADVAVVDLRDFLLRLRVRVEVHDGCVRIVYPDDIALFLRQ